METGFNSMRAMAELMSQMDQDEAVTLIESSRDILDALAKNPKVLKTFSSILKELSEDEEIAKGFSNLVSLAGPSISALNNAMTPEAVDMMHELTQDDDVKEGISSFLSIIDPEVLGALLPVVGSVIGAILSEISKDEESKEHLIGLISHSGALAEKANAALMGEPVD